MSVTETEGGRVAELEARQLAARIEETADRLKALYGSAASLTIGSRIDGTGCAVVIKLPFVLTPVRQPNDSAPEVAEA